MAGGGLFGMIASMVCEVGFAAAARWPQIQVLAVDVAQLAASPQGQVALQQAQQVLGGAGQLQQAASQAGNTGNPGGFDPNNWDPNKFEFKSGSSLRSHFESHVTKAGDEAWHELFGLTRDELASRAANPDQLTGLQDVYVQLGQRASTAANYIGAQSQGQKVFVDTGTRIVSVVQGTNFLSLYRITNWQEFVQSMAAKGLQLEAGLTLEALQKAMGY